MQQSHSAALSWSCYPHREGRLRKAHLKLASLRLLYSNLPLSQHATGPDGGFENSLCSRSQCWLCVVVLGLSSDSTYMSVQVLKIAGVASWTPAWAHPRAFPPVWVLGAVVCDKRAPVDLLMGLQFYACAPARRAGTWGGLMFPFLKANLIILRLRTLCPALDRRAWDRLRNGWSCSFAGCRNNC